MMCVRSSCDVSCIRSHNDASCARSKNDVWCVRSDEGATCLTIMRLLPVTSHPSTEQVHQARFIDNNSHLEQPT